MTNNFAGLVPANIRYARWDAIAWATLGFPFTDPNESGIFGLREGFKFNPKSVSVKEFAGRNMQNAVDVEMEGDLLQNDIPTIKTVHLLSTGPFHMRTKSQNGEYFIFRKNTGTVASPNGTRNVGMTYKVEIKKDSRKLNVKPKTRMFDTEWNYGLAQMGVAGAGGSGGSALGLSGMAYDRNKFIRSNFLAVRVNGYDVGELEDANIDMESSGRTTIHNITYCQILTVKNDVSIMQSAATELKAALDAANNDVTVEYDTANDETFKYTTGATSVAWDFSNTDKDRTVKLMFDGEIPYNVNNASPNSIYWGATPGLAEFKLIGTGA